MFKSIKRFVTRTFAHKTKTKSNPTLNDLPEEIIAKILEGIPRNEIQDFRLISQHFNASITAWFGTTLAINQSCEDFPESLRKGHVTILKLKDYTSSNPMDLPPLSRLRELEIEGVMRLQTLVHILGESHNLRKVSIKFPKVLDLDFDGTMVLDEPPAQIETLQIIIRGNEPAVRVSVESSLLQIFSQLPLSSLNLFNCIFLEEGLMADPMESPTNLSSLIRTILTKCRGTLRDLLLSRPYDWLEEPGSTPIEREFKLKSFSLLWVGQSRWLRSLIDAQRTRGGLESLFISCYEDFWVEGVVQEVALASSFTLKRLRFVLHLKDGQIIDDELSLRFLSQFPKLELFNIKSERDFIQSQGRRTLEEPLAPLILPPTLKIAALSGPITFQTLQSFCALPALEELTLEDFKWVDYPTLSALLTELENGVNVELTPSILLDWNWFKSLLINCPKLKSIKFEGCVLDIMGILKYLTAILKKKWRILPGLAFKDPRAVDVYLTLLNFPNVHLFEYTTSVNINRSDLDRFIPILKKN